MKTAKTKSEALAPVDCKCKLNLKAGEIGIKVSVKERGSEVKHYTAKGKIKYVEYFLAAIVKTFADLFKIEDIDLVKYQYEENNMMRIGNKEGKDLSDAEAQTRDMLAIQKVISEEAKK
ncbi:hypothetical protein KAR91_75780 [Candidatus Pacearchaeota archaeon]|nr:hypothetical protein [Candidatus Pacearchaeota archaeon]